MTLQLSPIKITLVDRHVPLASMPVPAGFPSPAADDLEDTIDPIKWVVRHEHATFWWRVSGDSLEAEGILDGDLIAVDRAGKRRHGRIVVAVVDGAITVKKLAKRDVKTETCIPTCVGIAPTKTLAKLANYAAKKNPIFSGVCNLMNEDVRDYVMRRIPVGEIWGVGSATEAKLKAQGIKSAADLRDLPLALGRKIGTVVLERLVAELRGLSCIDFEDVPPQRKGMAVTRSAGTPMTSFDTLAQAITAHATRAAEKLRQHGLVAGTMTVFYHTNPHKPDRPRHSFSRSIRLRPMSNHTFDLVDAAVAAARRGWKGDPSGNGYGYTKAGIILDDLLSEADRPAMLFPPDRPRDARLTDALDAINDRFGKKTMVLAREGVSRTWATKADHRSPRYTTRISELPTLKV
ncbi:hypothetical protein PLESTB_001965000 [Pleodorina starrii]|uniref:UmuC domain-containing protein n=1 Tax=Pleodorina starrii TaxID=330485 RepID=A0A9W6C3I2_9CHLO|nr:hypothetical protein PLESTB_001965000 [Pleodorina starrii]